MYIVLLLLLLSLLLLLLPVLPAASPSPQGYLVVVPDYFKGNPRKQSDKPDTFAEWWVKPAGKKTCSQLASSVCVFSGACIAMLQQTRLPS
jgi:hypothetical protein